MCTTPNDTCLRSFFLKVFFLPFFSGAATPAAAAAGFAMKIVLCRWSLVVRKTTAACGIGFGQRPKTDGQRPVYVFAAAFFLLATVPLRGPLRVRAFVCV